MKIITILGARPQFIKAAVVSRSIIKSNKKNIKNSIKEVIIHTGQHYEKAMSDVFFEEMDIPKPSYFLNINQKSHGAMTGQMIEAIEKILLDESPEMVLVYGDTNTTIAGALAAVKLHIPIAHIEAGLRSFNRMMPEEHNRVLTDHVSSYLFCPTNQAVNNLKKEGIVSEKIISKDKIQQNMLRQVYKVGDVMFDAAIYYSERSQLKALFALNFLKKKLRNRNYALVTVHREENTENKEKFRSIISAFKNIASDIPIVWPVHPRVSKKMGGEWGEIEMNKTNIFKIDPVGYLDIIQFIKNCSIVITDSGGLQKEAYFFRKPCVTMRDETEWVELVENGLNRVVGTNTYEIVNAIREMLETDLNFDQKLYGNGDAGDNIVSIIDKLFHHRN